MRMWLAVVLLAGSACSSSSATSSGTSSGSGSGGSDCAAFGQAACAAYERCFPGFAKLVLGTEVLSECAIKFGDECTRVGSLPDVTVTYATPNCVSALSNAQCEGLFDLYDGTCGPQPGVRQVGAGCAVSEQCQSLYCRTIGVDGGPHGCGVCASRVAAGQACTSYQDCVDDGDCRNGVCVPYAAQGAACDQDSYCDGNKDTCVSGTCQDAPDVGEVCTSACAGPLTCGTSGTCEGLPVRNVGEQCGTINNQYVYCAGQLCMPQGDGGSICQRPAALGQSCVDMVPPPCEFGLDCVNGICAKTNLGACN